MTPGPLTVALFAPPLAARQYGQVVTRERVSLMALNLPSVTSGSAFAPSVVLGRRYGFQMVGSHAVPDPAEMVNLVAIRDRADQRPVDDPMGIVGLPWADADGPVAVGPRSGEQPARVKDCHLRPKAHFERLVSESLIPTHNGSLP